jgi:hypothetical protein
VASGRINDWLGDYVPKTTSQIDQTTADRIKQVIDTYRQTPGMTIQDIAEKLRPVADPYRASMIAITEMTRASTQAVDNYQAYLTENGITTTMYWMTQNDEKECDICGPLHNEPKDEWPADQIDGPPAHPNCRCSTYITTRKAEEAPAPQIAQPQTLRDQDVDTIFNNARSLIAPDIQQTYLDAQADKAEAMRIMKEREKYILGSATDRRLENEYEAALKGYHEKIKQVQAEDERATLEFLRNLQNPTPQQANVVFTGTRFTPEQQQQIREVAQVAVGIAPDSGMPIQMNIVAWSDNGAAWEGSTNTMYINPLQIRSFIVAHESMHALQSTQKFGVAATDAFVAERIKGERKLNLGRVDPIRYHTSDKLMGYRDAVADPYTLREYANSGSVNTKFPEVLATALSSLTESTTGKDPELFKLFIQIVKDEGK